MALGDRLAGVEEGESRFILITQCLQNDFFLNPDCQLYLSDAEVKKILVAKKSQNSSVFETSNGRNRIKGAYLQAGPLGLFLEAVVGRRFTGEQPGVIHVINIRDWHIPDDLYEEERRQHGRHCEAGTWGAGYIEGLQQYLDPASPLPDSRAGFYMRGGVRIYHVHSDSLSDFRPPWAERAQGQPKLHPSELERLLDVLLTGSSGDLDTLATLLAPLETESDRGREQVLNRHALETTSINRAVAAARVYVVVLGVYTDVKVTTLLAGLNALFDIPNLAVSDTLSGSRTLERHLFALDFADKLLGTEVIHGLGDLAAFLGSELTVDESEIVSAPDFKQYRTYFADKRRVLAHQNERLQDYVQLTRRRSIRVYEAITRANIFLLLSGSLFLVVALATSIGNVIAPHRFGWNIVAVTGGLGIAQVVAVFFARPMREMQSNLNNLASFTMVLEGRALKQAFAEYHLTTPEVLREVRDDQDLAAALAQIEVLREQLAVIDESQKFDYDALGRFVRVQPSDAISVTPSNNTAATESSKETGEADASRDSTPADAQAAP